MEAPGHRGKNDRLSLVALAWKARESEQSVTAQRSKEMMGHKKTEREGGWKQTNFKVRKFVSLPRKQTHTLGEEFVWRGGKQTRSGKSLLSTPIKLTFTCEREFVSGLWKQTVYGNSLFF